MNIIEKLNSIDIKDLKKIDLGKAKDYFVAQPNIFINILLILITLFVIIHNIKKYIDLSRESHSTLRMLQDKSDIVQAQEAGKKTYEDYLENFPQAIPNNQLISKLSEFADSRQIQILTYSPAREQKKNNVVLTNVFIKVSAADYESMTLFIKDIEDAPYSLRVLQWRGSSNSRFIETDNAIVNTQSPIEAQIEIGSIRLQKS